MPTTDLAPLRPEPTMPTERLEMAITELAAHIHAATARWLLMVAEYDRRMAWADWDCKSCAHWLAWRCGLGMNAAREHVRVARSLTDLPLITKEFEAGHFSFSQVRALTRVATRANEADLVELARSAPTSQLEAMVRAFRGAARAEEMTDARRQQVARHLTYYYDDDGSFVISGRLSPEEGAVVEKALQVFESELEEEGFSAETLENDLESEVLSELGEEAFGELGPDADARAENEREDAKERFFASQMTSDVARRRADALVALSDAALANPLRSRSGADRYQVVAHIDIETLVDEGRIGRSELENGPPVPLETLRRLGCDCSIVSMVERDGEILSVGRKTRSIPTPIKRALVARDRHCRFPSCTSKVWVDGHHIQHWVNGGETKLGNLCLLCRAHHRAVHEYGYNVRSIDGELVFFRPDGSRIENPGPKSSDPDMVIALNHQARLDIDHETSVPDWYGDRWDYDVTVARLLDDHGFGEQRPTGSDG
jgi:uncharacterized protein YciI